MITWRRNAFFQVAGQRESVGAIEWVFASISILSAGMAGIAQIAVVRGVPVAGRIHIG